MASPNKFVEVDGAVYQLVDEAEPKKRGVVATIYAPQKGNASFTVEDLMEAFPEIQEGAAQELVRKAPKTGMQKSDAYLREADEAIDGFGVETVGVDEDIADKLGLDLEDRYIAEYVNTGDSYSATILFDYEDDTVYLTTWGDWYEAWKHQKREDEDVSFHAEDV